jgi:hypothetical protein
MKFTNKAEGKFWSRMVIVLTGGGDWTPEDVIALADKMTAARRERATSPQGGGSDQCIVNTTKRI